MNRKERYLASAMLLAAVGTGIMAATSPARVKAPEEASKNQVSIDNFSFAPGEITVAKGTTVNWVNRDDIPHTVVSPDKVFKSKVLDTDEQFSFTFSTPGTFPYFCSIHPKMTGKVVVQ